MKFVDIVRRITLSGAANKRISFWPFLLTSIVLPQSFPIFFQNPLVSSRRHFAFALPQSKLSYKREMVEQLQDVSYVDAELAKLIDDRLMTQPGYSIDQLMELAGYSVACAAHELIQKKRTTSTDIYVYCGPGNNGGDGLVAARHLKHFGFSPVVIYPKPSSGSLFDSLVHQLNGLDVPVRTMSPSNEESVNSALVVDAMFGFSFKGPSRDPFSSIIQQLTSVQDQVSILSVDIPSGWDVNNGDVFSSSFNPSATISLTLPKLCMRSYTGIHYVGGRFMPPGLAKELNVVMPNYGNGVSQIALLSPGISPLAEENEESKYVAMYSTASSPEEAKRIAHQLVAKKLVACVNIIPQVQSIYEWDGKVEESNEFMLMIKTQKKLAEKVTSAIKEIHSYDVPEVITVNLDTAGSNSEYLEWVKQSTDCAK